MHTYIMHTQYSADTFGIPQSQEEHESRIMDRIRTEYPQMEWINVIILGPHDCLDVFRAPDIDTASKVATLMRTLAHAHTEVWPATELGESNGPIRPLYSGKE